MIEKERVLPSWIDGFVQYTAGRSTKTLFARWAAIGTVAAALERKTWLMSQHKPVYPNMYIFLVGPPGVGKTYVIDLAHQIFDEALVFGMKGAGHHCAKTTLSKAGLIDTLALATRTTFNPDLTFNALFVPSEELSMLLPEYNKEFISALTAFFDNGKYEEQYRNVNKGEPTIIERPCLTILGGTTPAYMASAIPVTAWDDGFLARVIIIYGEDGPIDTVRPELSLLDEAVEDNTSLERQLVADLKIIGNIKGRMKWSSAAADYFKAWYQARCPWPDGAIPTHPRLQHYCTRRHFHALKLCHISAVDQNNEFITAEDVERVRGWMYEAEEAMPGIFSGMESGGDAAIIRDAYHFVQIEDARGGCPESKLLAFLAMRTPSTYVTRIKQNMIESKILATYVGPDKYTFVRAVPGAFGTIRTLPKS